MKLSNLAGVLRTAGLTVVECDGWASRGYAGQDLADVRGVLWHHTATNRQRFNDSDAPTLSMCMNGRSDLAGPLCNIVFGRNGTVYLVAAGVANHAGAGSTAGIPANMGNHYLIGIEMESSGIAPWDWTPDQLRVAPHLGAALERAYGASIQIAHYEYSSQGKIDPAGWPGGMDGLRASINAILDGISIILASSESITPVQEDDMFSESDRAALARIDAKVDPLPSGDYWRDMINAMARVDQRTWEAPGKQYWSDLINAMARVDASAATGADPQALAAAIAEALPKSDAEALVDALAERLGGK